MAFAGPWRFGRDHRFAQQALANCIRLYPVTICASVTGPLSRPRMPMLIPPTRLTRPVVKEKKKRKETSGDIGAASIPRPRKHRRRLIRRSAAVLSTPQSFIRQDSHTKTAVNQAASSFGRLALSRCFEATCLFGGPRSTTCQFLCATHPQPSVEISRLSRKRQLREKNWVSTRGRENQNICRTRPRQSR